MGRLDRYRLPVILCHRIRLCIQLCQGLQLSGLVLFRILEVPVPVIILIQPVAVVLRLCRSILCLSRFCHGLSRLLPGLRERLSLRNGFRSSLCRRLLHGRPSSLREYVHIFKVPAAAAQKYILVPAGPGKGQILVKGNCLLFRLLSGHGDIPAEYICRIRTRLFLFLLYRGRLRLGRNAQSRSPLLPVSSGRCAGLLLPFHSRFHFFLRLSVSTETGQILLCHRHGHIRRKPLRPAG